MHSSGDTLQDRYHIERVLGRGGMGGVYLATHQALEAKVAIKEMTLEIGNEEDRVAAIRQFKKEAQILHLLQHENLPRVHDFFEQDGKYYLVMDYIEGRTLQQLITVSPMPEADMHGINRPLCAVLEYLHNYSPPIIFRDLKPSNIMVTPEGQLKLIDFGIAKDFDAGTGRGTQTSVRGAGTRGFAAPEQYGAGSDVRTDIYALGATLYNLLTQVIPPDSVDIASGGAEVQPLLDLRPDVSPSTARVIEWMLAINRTQRPASMREVSTAFGYQNQAPFTVMPQRVLDQIQVDEDRVNPNVTRNRFQSAQKTAHPPVPGPAPAPRMEQAPPTRLSPPEPAPVRPAPVPPVVPGRRSSAWMVAIAAIVVAGLAVLGLRLKTPTMTVHLTSVPTGAEVIVNHTPYANTPCDVPDVPTQAPMLVELTRPGYNDFRQSLKVEAAPPAITLIPSMTYIKVWGTPKATLLIDDTAWGEVGEEIPVSIAPGPHTITIREPGYKDYVTATTIEPAVEPKAIEYKLQVLPVTLEVRGPSGAAVTIDGKLQGKIGKASLVVKDLIPDKTYPIQVEAPGYTTFASDFTPKAGQADTLDTHMTRIEVPHPEPVAVAPAATVTVLPPPTPTPQASTPIMPASTPQPSPTERTHRSKDDDKIIAATRIGDLWLGDRIEEVAAAHGLVQTGPDSTRYDGRGFSVLTDDNGVIIAIGCGPTALGRFHTRGGITLGTPVEEVKRAFPKGIEGDTPQGWGYRCPRMGIFFRLDRGQVKWICVLSKNGLKDKRMRNGPQQQPVPAP